MQNDAEIITVITSLSKINQQARTTDQKREGFNDTADLNTEWRFVILYVHIHACTYAYCCVTDIYPFARAITGA